MEKEQTFYQELKAKGYTRRQFLKFCGIMGAMLGLHQTGIAQVVNALQTKPRKPVLWFHFQECTCCSESFLRSSHPLVGQILLEMISLDYSVTAHQSFCPILAQYTMAGCSHALYHRLTPDLIAHMRNNFNV